MPIIITGGTLHVPSATASAQLTSLPEIQRTFSVEGVSNHTEDLSVNVEVMNEIVQRASETVLQYLRVLYRNEDLELSVFARSKATFIACYYLSTRMGNPALYQDHFENAMMELVQARDGFIDIGLPTLPRIVVQKQYVDRRSFRPLRVMHGDSSHVYPGQRTQGQYHGYGW